jgi:pyruvate/2-oxoglutarate dehydrogenase complex dihydrolipoamide acyltransferase (E2) component
MLCEVETAILNLGLPLPISHKSVIVTESSNWAREGDLTLMLIQDSGVLRLYQAFLNDWIRALRNATATGPGTCDPAMLRPLTSYFKPKKLSKSPHNAKRPKMKLAQARKRQQQKQHHQQQQQQQQHQQKQQQHQQKQQQHQQQQQQQHQQQQQRRAFAQNARRLARKKIVRKKQKKVL